ncbi:MAG: hypothetical protein ACRDLQ_12165 [Solirubrobacterales bacterium]
MRRAWIAVVAATVLAVPGVAFAQGGDGSQSSRKNASKVCKALRAEMGRDLFRQTYGTNHNRRNAHGKCVSRHRHGVRKLVAQAVTECKAQREATQSRHRKGDDDSRAERRADRRAFRRCVREKLRALLAERRAAFEAAAKTCDAERTADRAAFRQKYGRGERKRHAFFRCVVQTVRASQAAKVS